MATRPAGAITQAELRSPQRRAKREWQDEPEDEPEDAHPPKRQELSEQNLRLLHALQTPTRPRSVKRSSSMFSTGIAISDPSERSEATIYADPPQHIPDAVMAVINAIIRVRPPQERRDELNGLAQKFHGQCREMARVADGGLRAAHDDDFFYLLYVFLIKMRSTSLCLGEKSDWAEDLKSEGRPSCINLNLRTRFKLVIGGREQAVDGASLPPTERRHLSSSDLHIPSTCPIALTASYCARPMRLQEPSAIPPPFPESEGEHSPISDITIRLTSLAISCARMETTRTELFLQKLRFRMVRQLIGGEPGPTTASDLPVSKLHFPFAVFEAKTPWSSSALIALKMQHDLNDLVDASPENQPPLFFSIYTDGPIYELWVHWKSMEDGVPKSNREIMKACNGGVREDAEDFFVAVDNMLHWGVNQFADSVGERLETLTGMTVAVY